MPNPGNDTPTTVEIKIVKETDVVIDDCTEYTFYVNGQEYQKLPLDANVREPNTAKSKPYKDMCRTLQETPEKFFENNLGISVVASRVEKLTEKRYRLTFNSGTGILNGGHTQQAVLDSKEYSQIGRAIVKITVRAKAYELSRIAEIAAAQNSSTAVKEYSLAEKKGLFLPIKQALECNNEKHIIWYEGRQVPNDSGMKPDDLIALINVFNIDLYHSEYSLSSKSQPTSSSNSKASVFKKWENDPDSYFKLYPLVNDMLMLGDYIRIQFYEGGTNMTSLKVIDDSKNISKKPLVFTGEICKYNLPSQFFYPLISSFRANIYYDSENEYIGWYRNIFELFNVSKKSLCEKLRSFYKTSYSNNINKAGKDPNLYETLYVTLKSYIDTNSEPDKKYPIPKERNY